MGMIVLALVAAVWLGVALVVFAASLFGALLQPRLQLRRAKRTDTPAISLLLPVKLLNEGFERAQRSAFAQDLACFEIIIGAVETHSPALAIIRELCAAETAPSRVLAVRGRGAASPKLDTLSDPIDAARYPVIATKDANITFSPDTLRKMARSLTPDVGLVCAVPVAVRASGLAGQIEAILINRDARLLLTASASGKGYGVGKVMLFRHDDLRRAGGVAALAYTIAEDTALSRAMARIGLRTAFAHNTVDQEIGRRRMGEVYGRQARWAVIRRAEEPLTFAFEPIACPLPSAVAALVAAPLINVAPWMAGLFTLAAWYGVEVAVTAIKGWELAPWTPAAFIGRDVVLLAAWARAWFTREVNWAGSRQDVRKALGTASKEVN